MYKYFLTDESYLTMICLESEVIMDFDETKRKFLHIVNMYLENNELSYIDAILSACEELEIEPEDATKYITVPLREKLLREGQDINILPKSAKLPI